MSDVHDGWDWNALRVRCLKEAMSMSRSSADAEDIVQEALTRAWRMRRQCRDERRPTPWVVQITRNEARRHRSRRTDQPLDPHTGWLDIDIATPEPDAMVERLALRRALGTLGEDERKVLILRYARDLTQPGVAHVLGVPEGTVKVRLHRARANLRTAWSGR